MLRCFLIVCLFVFFLVSILLADARDKQVYVTETKRSFKSVSLQKEFFCTKIGAKSIASDTGSFAKAGDTYAYSCGGALIPKEGTIELQEFGETVFTDKNGNVLSRFGESGILQGIGDKVILQTTEDKFFMFSKQSGFQAKELKFRDSTSFELYLTNDDSSLFCFNDFNILAESIEIQKDGFATLVGRKIPKKVSKNRITRFGYAFIKGGTLFAKRWSKSSVGVASEIIETDEPIHAILNEYERISNSRKIFDYDIEAFVTSGSIILKYSKRNITIITSRVGSGWVTRSFCDIPPRTVGLTPLVKAIVNPYSSDILLPFKRDLVILSLNLEQKYRCKGMGKMAYFPSNIEIDEHSFLLVSKCCRVFHANSNGVSPTCTKFDLAFSDVVLFEDGIIRVTSNIETTEISVQKYPSFTAETSLIKGNVFLLSNEHNGSVLLVSDNEDGETIWKINAIDGILEEVKRLPKDRKVLRVFLSSNRYAYSCSLVPGNKKQTVFVHYLDNSALEVSFSIVLSKTGECPNRLRILEMSDKDVILQSVYDTFQVGVYRYSNDAGVEKMEVKREKWSRNARKKFYSSDFSLQYSCLNDGKGRIVVSSLIDEVTFTPRSGGRMFVGGESFFHSLSFFSGNSYKQLCLLIDEDGKRHLWELDRFVGYVYAPSTNPDKLYSPSIVPGKIIEFTRDK